MEQNGASNGQEAKLQKSPSASGANKSPKKRRKVNHGRSSTSATSRRVPETCTDLWNVFLQLVCIVADL
jgi:hypothetical protein